MPRMWHVDWNWQAAYGKDTTKKSCHVCGMWIEIYSTQHLICLSTSCHVCGMWIEIDRYEKIDLRQQSCHVCGMWIEMLKERVAKMHLKSCHVCGMWIEIRSLRRAMCHRMRHATYVACGLKCGKRIRLVRQLLSCHVCGMWIEMTCRPLWSTCRTVMPRMWHVDWNVNEPWI